MKYHKLKSPDHQAQEANGGVVFIQHALARVTASEELQTPMSPESKTGRLQKIVAKSGWIHQMDASLHLTAVQQFEMKSENHITA